MLNAKENWENAQWLQLMLLRGWLAQIEKEFNWLIPPRQPYCLVGSNAEEIILYA